jgi:hypothetical protein
MQAICSSEMLAEFQWNTPSYIPEERIFIVTTVRTSNPTCLLLEFYIHLSIFNICLQHFQIKICYVQASCQHFLKNQKLKNVQCLILPRLKMYLIHVYKNTSSNVNAGDKMQYINHASETLFHPVPTIQELVMSFCRTIPSPAMCKILLQSACLQLQLTVSCSKHTLYIRNKKRSKFYTYSKLFPFVL